MNKIILSLPCLFLLYKLLLQRTLVFCFSYFQTFVLRGKAGLSPWHGVSRYLLCSTWYQVGSKGHTFHFGSGLRLPSSSVALHLTACNLQCPEQSEVHLPAIVSSVTALLMSLRANTTHHLLQSQTEFITLRQFKKGRRQCPDILLLRGAAKLCIIHKRKVIKTQPSDPCSPKEGQKLETWTFCSLPQQSTGIAENNTVTATNISVMI